MNRLNFHHVADGYLGWQEFCGAPSKGDWVSLGKPSWTDPAKRTFVVVQVTWDIDNGQLTVMVDDPKD
jgi:hypothetical protein